MCSFPALRVLQAVGFAWLTRIAQPRAAGGAAEVEGSGGDCSPSGDRNPSVVAVCAPPAVRLSLRSASVLMFVLPDGEQRGVLCLGLLSF